MKSSDIKLKPIFLCAFLAALSAWAQSNSVPPPRRHADPLAQFLGRNGYVALPFQFNYYVQPVCTLQLEGVDLKAYPDTGASYSILTESAADRLELGFLEQTATVMIPGDNPIQARIAISSNVVAAGVPLLSMSSIVFPHRIEDPQDRADLAIGLLYLKRHAALIDYLGMRLFLRPGGQALEDLDPLLAKQGYRQHPISCRNNQWYIDGFVNGIPALLNVDSGTSRCYLFKHWAEAHAIPLTASSMRTDGAAINAANLYIAGVTNLQVCGRTVANPEIRSFDIGDTNRPEAGYLGSMDLSLMGALLDVGRDCLYLPQLIDQFPPSSPASTPSP